MSSFSYGLHLHALHFTYIYICTCHFLKTPLYWSGTGVSVRPKGVPIEPTFFWSHPRSDWGYSVNRVVNNFLLVRFFGCKFGLIVGSSIVYISNLVFFNEYQLGALISTKVRSKVAQSHTRDFIFSTGFLVWLWSDRTVIWFRNGCWFPWWFHFQTPCKLLET